MSWSRKITLRRLENSSEGSKESRKKAIPRLGKIAFQTPGKTRETGRRVPRIFEKKQEISVGMQTTLERHWKRRQLTETCTLL